MTEHQVFQAARRLCELRGIDPDIPVPHSAPPDANGVAPLALLHSAAYLLVANEVRDAVRMREALAFGEGTP